MNAVWRGAITFGLVTIGVRVFTATEEHNFRFHQVHGKDGGRIKYQRICSHCGQEVEYAEIVKGYETESGALITVDKEDLEKLPTKASRSIDVMEFVPAEEIDPIYFGKSYFLEPQNEAARSYVLLRETLRDSGKYALVKISMRQRETLALLRARDDVLVLHTMLWPDEIRKPWFEFLDDEPEVRQQELAMATSLVDSMSADFEPQQYDDEYRDALGELIDAKAQGAEVPDRSDTDGDAEVVDLMTALRRSVQSAKAARGEQAGDGQPDESDTGTAKTGGKTSGGSGGAKKGEPAASAKTAGSAKNSTAKNSSTDDSRTEKKPAKRKTGSKRSA